MMKHESTSQENRPLPLRRCRCKIVRRGQRGSWLPPLKAFSGNNTSFSNIHVLVHINTLYGTAISTHVSLSVRPLASLTVGFRSTREHRQGMKVRQIGGQIPGRQMSSSRPWWNIYSPTSRRCASGDSVNTCWWPPQTARSVPLGCADEGVLHAIKPCLCALGGGGRTGALGFAHQQRRDDERDHSSRCLHSVLRMRYQVPCYIHQYQT